MSKLGIEKKHLHSRLIGDNLPQIPAKLSATITNYPGVKGRNSFQTQLQVLAELVFEDISGAPGIEETFLKECYCQSGALSQHSLLAKQILEARYEALLEKATAGPTILPSTSKKGISPDLLAESVSRRPVLLLGDVGSGKTIFVRNLIKIEASSFLKDAIIVHLDLGSRTILAMDLREAIFDDIKNQLRNIYNIDIEKNDFVHSVYNTELKRFSEGIYSEFKETDPHLFKKKEVEFLEQKLIKQDAHIKNSLNHIAATWQKQTVLFLDNADQRGPEIQEQVFLIAAEIAANWPAMVFVTLRPQTFYQSLKCGPLSGYHPKAFTISPPRIDQVLNKRLHFAIKVASGEIPIPRLKSTKMELNALTTIISSFIVTIDWSNELVECIDNIAGGNVRLALDLVRGFFGSGHINTEKIVDKYRLSGQYYIRLHEFLRSVMYGDTEHYDPEKSCISNIFDVYRADPKEHFLMPVMISYIYREGNKSDQKGFINISKVYDRLQAIGYTAEQIDMCVVKGCRNKLIETEARKLTEDRKLSDPLPPMPAFLRATSVGIYHIERLCRMFTYIDAI